MLYCGMRVLQGIKPQDILVLLKLCLWQEREWRHVDLASELGLSQTEVSFALERCRASGFLDEAKKRVNRSALIEFLAHGLKYVYPVQPGSLCRGMPTAHSAPPLAGKIVSDEHDQYVWPHGEGKMRGQAIEPLYASVPFAAEKDPQLHELLALVDALRVGRARERSLAAEELELRIGPKKA
jgi:predicted transcriptional regulator